MAGNNLEEVEEVEAKDETLSDVPPEYLIKHPLQHTWTLWYYENDRQRDWKDNLREITSFDTIEDFWSVYNHIKLASELRQGSDYSLFKQGVQPMWEDDANRKGGRWLINLEKKQRINDLDRFWLEIILCMIGEAFENSEDICGAVVNIRNKGDKLAVWTGDSNNSNAVMEIGRKLKERLHIAPKLQIGYQIHKDSMAKSGSITKNSYYV